MQPDPPIVLIVDPHEDSLAMYAIGLLALGFQPVTAKHAEEGFGQACACRPEKASRRRRGSGPEGPDSAVAKIGVLVGSIFAAALGAVVLIAKPRARAASPAAEEAAT